MYIAPISLICFLRRVAWNLIGRYLRWNKKKLTNYPEHKLSRRYTADIGECWQYPGQQELQTWKFFTKTGEERRLEEIIKLAHLGHILRHGKYGLPQLIALDRTRKDTEVLSTLGNRRVGVSPTTTRDFSLLNDFF